MHYLQCFSSQIHHPLCALFKLSCVKQREIPMAGWAGLPEVGVGTGAMGGYWQGQGTALGRPLLSPSLAALAFISSWKIEINNNNYYKILKKSAARWCCLLLPISFCSVWAGVTCFLLSNVTAVGDSWLMHKTQNVSICKAYWLTPDANAIPSSAAPAWETTSHSQPLLFWLYPSQ